jgi:flagellar basal-body rod protein FlgF
MIRGLYTSALGMVTQGYKQEITANNMANVNTGGFKRQIALARALPSRPGVMLNGAGVTQVISPAIGLIGFGSALSETRFCDDPGKTIQTGNHLDVAIDGPGYFIVATPFGNRLTRRGDFQIGANGRLGIEGVGAVLSVDGRTLAVPEGEIRISKDGTVYANQRAIGQIGIFVPNNPGDLVNFGDGMFGNGDGEVTPVLTNGNLITGGLESSNVNILNEMVEMISAVRAYEMGQRMIQAQDQTLDRLINEVGRVN